MAEHPEQTPHSAKPQHPVEMGTEIQPLGLNPFYEQTGNIYYAVVILGMRAEQIGSKVKHELNDKLAEFGTSSESLEEVVENREQIEIAKHYENLPKPTLLAIEEFLNDETYFKLHGHHDTDAIG